MGNDAIAVTLQKIAKNNPIDTEKRALAQQDGYILAEMWKVR